MRRGSCTAILMLSTSGKIWCLPKPYVHRRSEAGRLIAVAAGPELQQQLDVEGEQLRTARKELENTRELYAQLESKWTERPTGLELEYAEMLTRLGLVGFGQMDPSD